MTCACRGSLGVAEGNGDGWSLRHGEAVCVFEEYRPLRFRFFRALGSMIDNLRGPCREVPKVTVIAAPSGSAEASEDTGRGR